MKLLASDLGRIEGVSHGFFTREGGVSEGLYGSLNCAYSSGDKAEHVRENRARVAASLGIAPESIVTLKQVHSAKAVKVTGLWDGEAPEADALVTDQPGIGIAVLTADCAPVLFAAEKQGIVGAAHAGWKGAVFGVLDATVKAMVEMGVNPADITAAIGPCIGPQSYEVSEGFENPFIAQSMDSQKFFAPGAREGHLVFDLPGYIATRLQKLGVGNIQDTEQDTLSNEATFFSYRRTCLNKEPDYGRQISVISVRA